MVQNSLQAVFQVLYCIIYRMGCVKAKSTGDALRSVWSIFYVTKREETARLPYLSLTQGTETITPRDAGQNNPPQLALIYNILHFTQYFTLVNTDV